MVTRIRSFLKTLYLGDRACKGVLIDGWSDQVKVQVDCISRIRSASGMWEFYSEEDIENGWIVFEGVTEVRIENEFGFLPNDAINEIRVVEEAGTSAVVEVLIDALDERGLRHATTLRVRCNNLHLEDPERPNLPIVD